MSIPFQLESSWIEQLSNEINHDRLCELARFLDERRAVGVDVYPPKEHVFEAFSCTPFDQVKVMIMGQDPYHGPGQAHGLSFSVNKGIKLPPSLKNIYKELYDDLGIIPADHGYLKKWADQGVLLLNSVLTVEKGKPFSHHGKGWEEFTQAVISKLFEREEPLVFVLWGKAAEEKLSSYISVNKQSKHLILRSSHPSPFSARRGFFGCRHFSKINDFLVKNGKKPINFQL